MKPTFFFPSRFGGKYHAPAFLGMVAACNGMVEIKTNQMPMSLMGNESNEGAHLFLCRRCLKLRK